jgi:hypothetical protein
VEKGEERGGQGQRIWCGGTRKMEGERQMTHWGRATATMAMSLVESGLRVVRVASASASGSQASLSSGQCYQPLPVARRIHFRPHAEATCPNSCSLSGSALAPMGPTVARRPRANCQPSQMLISRSNNSTEPTISDHPSMSFNR